MVERDGPITSVDLGPMVPSRVERPFGPMRGGGMVPGHKAGGAERAASIAFPYNACCMSPPAGSGRMASVGKRERGGAEPHRPIGAAFSPFYRRKAPAAFAPLPALTGRGSAPQFLCRYELPTLKASAMRSPSGGMSWPRKGTSEGRV